MCFKQFCAKQVPVTGWPIARAFPSTPGLLHGVGMWEKLVTRGLPILPSLSRLMCEHSEVPRCSQRLRDQRGDVFMGEGLNRGGSDRRTLKPSPSQSFSLSPPLPLFLRPSCPPSFPFFLTPPSSLIFYFVLSFFFEGSSVLNV